MEVTQGFGFRQIRSACALAGCFKNKALPGHSSKALPGNPQALPGNPPGNLRGNLFQPRTFQEFRAESWAAFRVLQSRGVEVGKKFGVGRDGVLNRLTPPKAGGGASVVKLLLRPRVAGHDLVNPLEPQVVAPGGVGKQLSERLLGHFDELSELLLVLRSPAAAGIP